MSRFSHIKKVESAGIRFDSKLERSVHTMLKTRELAGEIRILQCQDVVYLSRAKIRYEPDFKCLDVKSGEEFWCEAKGYANERWPMKKRLWKFYGPGKLEIWKGTYQRPFLDEIVIPKMSEEENE